MCMSYNLMSFGYSIIHYKDLPKTNRTLCLCMHNSPLYNHILLEGMQNNELTPDYYNHISCYLLIQI